MSLAKLLPYWDEVIPIDLKKIQGDAGYRWKILSELRRRGFAIVIQASFSRTFSIGDSLIRATGAARRIGAMGDLSNIKSWKKMVSDKWYTQLVHVSPEPMMELQRNAEFVRGLGLQCFAARVPMLPKLINLPLRLTIDQRYFVILPGALWSGRLWPTVRFGEVLSKLIDSTGWRAVLCGSTSERGLCNQVIHAAGRKALNLAGETSLPELAEVIRQAEFLIGNESSSVHLAAAVGTPSVCILGGGHYGRFMPYVIDEGVDHTAPVPVSHRMGCFGCNWQCNHDDDVSFGRPAPCIDGISVENVWTVVSLMTEKCARNNDASPPPMPTMNDTGSGSSLRH